MPGLRGLIHRFFPAFPPFFDSLGAAGLFFEVKNEAVADVAEKEEDKAYVPELVDQNGSGENEDEGAEAGAGAPVDIFEAGEFDRADHQPGDQEHEYGEDDRPKL